MFDELLQLPLFQGITADQLLLFAGRFPLHFETLPPNFQLISQGEISNELFFIINGKVRKRIALKETKAVLIEEINSPFSIPPLNFFCKREESIASWETITQTKVLRVRKEDYLKMIHSNKIMMISLLEMIANQAQNATVFALDTSLNDLKRRFASWLLMLTHEEADHIVLSGSRNEVSLVFGISALTLKKLYGELIDQGIALYKDRRLFIADRRKLEELLLMP